MHICNPCEFIQNTVYTQCKHLYKPDAPKISSFYLSYIQFWISAHFIEFMFYDATYQWIIQFGMILHALFIRIKLHIDSTLAKFRFRQHILQLNYKLVRHDKSVQNYKQHVDKTNGWSGVGAKPDAIVVTDVVFPAVDTVNSLINYT